jgi:hypothetical protein
VGINYHCYHAEQKEKTEKRWNGRGCMLTYSGGERRRRRKFYSMNNIRN